MKSQKPDEGICPVCGEEYAELARVKRGDRWNDFFPGTLFDYFNRYYRRCAAQYDVQNDKHVLKSKKVIYFHSRQEIQKNSAPF